MGYSEAFIRATQRIREQEHDARIEMKDSITPSRIAWHVYRDANKRGDGLCGLENCSKKDIEEAKAKLAVGQSDFEDDYSEFFLTRVPKNFLCRFPGPDSTAPEPISCISRPTLHWIEFARPMSLLDQCSQRIVSEGHYYTGLVSEGHYYPGTFSINVRWSSRKLLFVPGSIECLEKEIMGLIKSREGLPIPLEDLPDIYYRKYGSCLAIDGYKSQYGKPCSLNEALGSKMNSIKLHTSQGSPLQIISLKDPGIVIPNWVHISSSSNANFGDIRAHFNKFDKRAILLHRQPTGKETLTYGYIMCSNPVFASNILSTYPHQVGKYEVLVRPYTKQPYPPASRDPGFDLEAVSVRALGSSKFQYVMGYEEAHCIQYFEDEDHRISINLPPRDERWFSGPNVEDLPDDPFDIDYREDSSSIQQ